MDQIFILSMIMI